ncbi:hypothetical protein [Nonomuraea sp. NPDC002799]
MRSRAWAALSAVAAVCLLASQPAAAQAAVKFYADSGDSCVRGITEGILEQVQGPVIRPTVRVSGYLADETSSSPCALDNLHSRATFNGYNGTTLVDTETVKADNATVPLSFTLSDAAGVTVIERVVVTVCRHPNSPIGISYCGKAATYKLP